MKIMEKGDKRKQLIGIILNIVEVLILKKL